MSRWGPWCWALLLVSACADDPETNPPTLDPTETVYVGGKGDVYADADGCVVTLCLTGALQHETPSNTHFRELCEDPRIQGVKFDCHGEVCNSTFDSFLQFPLLSVYPALVDALDVNRDGVVDGMDPICEVNLIGFSWGGVNAISVAGHLARDGRIPESHRRVRRTVLLDAFQPLSSQRMRVPYTVDSVLSLRHSVAPADDCSRGSLFGPYLGFAPICDPEQQCMDYDYSVASETLFEDRQGWAYFGDEVGHCLLPAVAHENVVSYLNDAPMTDPLPPPTTQ